MTAVPPVRCAALMRTDTFFGPYVPRIVLSQRTPGWFLGAQLGNLWFRLILGQYNVKKNVRATRARTSASLCSPAARPHVAGRPRLANSQTPPNT